MNRMQNGPSIPRRHTFPFFERKAANGFRCPFFVTDGERGRRLRQGKGDFSSQLSRGPLIFCGIDDDELSESGIRF